jgi:hypothetical protein
MIAFPFELRTSEPSLASDGRRGGETCSAGSSLACSKNGYFRGSWHTLLSHSYLWTVYYYVFQTSGLEGHWNQYNLRWGSSPPVDLSKKTLLSHSGQSRSTRRPGRGRWRQPSHHHQRFIYMNHAPTSLTRSDIAIIRIGRGRLLRSCVGVRLQTPCSFGTRARSHLTPAAPPRRISSRAIYSSVVEAELPRN